MGSQPLFSGKDDPLQCSYLITAGVKRINWGGEVGWVFAEEDFWGRDTGQKRTGKVCRLVCGSLQGRKKRWEEAKQNTCVIEKLKLAGKLLH